MNRETELALSASIEHWRENEEAECFTKASVESADCALCADFYHEDCQGCPVAQSTGRTWCRGTPYQAAADALDHWAYGEKEDAERHREEFRACAKREREFLESLLDEVL